MLFKPLRACALFRSPTSQSQFTKYVFGSEVQTHKLLYFFSLSIGRALPLSLLPLHAAPCAIENIVLSFFFVKCPHEVECKMATVLIRRAHAVNCVEQSVPLGDKRRPGTLVPDEKKIGAGGGGGGWGGCFLIWWYEARNRQICFSPSKQAVIAVKICLFSGIHLHKSENAAFLDANKVSCKRWRPVGGAIFFFQQYLPPNKKNESPAWTPRVEP